MGSISCDKREASDKIGTCRVVNQLSNFCDTSVLKLPGNWITPSLTIPVCLLTSHLAVPISKVKKGNVSCWYFLRFVCFFPSDPDANRFLTVFQVYLYV